MDTTAPDTVQWRAVGLFIAIAMGAAFALDAVCAATGGLGTPLATVLMAARMFSPALGSWAACRLVTGEPWLRAAALRRAASGRGGWGRVLTSALIGVAVVLVATAVCLMAAITAGWLEADWSLSRLMAQSSAVAPDKPMPPPGVLLALITLQTLIGGCTVNVVLALGEETGWRGWLLGALAPLGARRAVALTGAVWGLWHAPLIAMGYEYAYQIPAAVGIALFTLFCMGFGTLLAWLRTRSGSILPAAIAHGTLNAFGSFPVLLLAPGHTWRTVTSSIAGLPGVLLFAIVAAALLSARRVKVVPEVKVTGSTES